MRREEERIEREKAEAKKRATHDMFTREIELNRAKRDQVRHEEMVYDMKLLEDNIQGLDDQSAAIRQRKVTYTAIPLPLSAAYATATSHAYDATQSVIQSPWV